MSASNPLRVRVATPDGRVRTLQPRTLPKLTVRFDRRSNRVVFSGGRHGEHSLDLDASTEERVAAHAEGYAEANGITKDTRPDAWIAYRARAASLYADLCRPRPEAVLVAHTDPTVCRECDIEERVRNGLCAWCRADEDGRPYGTCRHCEGAKASDGTCACTADRGRVR